MADSFIIYTPNPPSISTLTSSGKQIDWTKITKNLEKILEDYKKNDLANQEMLLFEIFLDKPLKEMNCLQFYKVVKRIMDKINYEIKDNNYRKTNGINFDSSDKSVFELTFKNIVSIVYLIINIIDNIITKGKISDAIYDFAFNSTIPKFKDIQIYKKKLSDIVNILGSVETIKINLYKDNEDIYCSKKNTNNNMENITYQMDQKIVFFFTLFFKSIFKSITTAYINLNISPIDDYYIKNPNPYLIKEEQIIKIGDYYRDIILCNLILIKTLPTFTNLTNLNFQMYDSYQLELHNILSVSLDNDIIFELDTRQSRLKTHANGANPINYRRKSADYKKVDKKKEGDNNSAISYSKKFNNNYLYIQHLLTAPETKYFNFCLDFNSLDPLLFNSVNYLLTKFTYLTELNLLLFPNKTINKRKIYINKCFYNKYDNGESLNLYSSEDKKIYYQYLNNKNENDNNFILKDEKLLNELFDSFNNNLRTLSIILEKRMSSLLSLKIDFSTYNNESISLYNYDNYNCSIVCFIFDLFKIFQSQIDQCFINKLELLYDDFLDEKYYVVETAKNKIPSCQKGFMLNNLKLKYINVNISNISLFLPFENFPSITLTELIISNLSYNDLNNLVSAFEKKKNLFPVLVKLDASLGIMGEDYTKPLKKLLTECLCLLPQLLYFDLNLPFNVSDSQLIDIIYWIKCNRSTDIAINIKLYNSLLSKYTNSYCFGNYVEELFKSNKDLLNKRNIETIYEIVNLNTIKFKMNKIDYKSKEYFYKLIYCFQKKNTLNINMSKRKIFDKIINFGVKYKKYEVNIEIIN